MEEAENQIALSVTDGDLEEGCDLHKPHQIFFTDIPIKQEHSEEMTNYQHEDGSGFLAPIKLETVTEVSGVCSVIKEEVIVGNLHNEDINEVIALSVTDGDLEEGCDLYKPHQIFFTDIPIKQEHSEEMTNYQHEDELYSCTSKNRNTCEEVDSTEECRYARHSIKNQPVFSPPPSLLKYCTPVHKNNNHKCDVCGKTFSYAKSLSRHKLIHSGIKKYQCDVCTKTFTHANSLSRHKLIHSGIKNYQCDVCTKSFTQSHSLAQHKLIHFGIKNYQCEVCTKTFTHANSLSRHKSIHSSIKNYQCDVCTKSFTQSQGLVRHKLIHSGVKKFQCDVCTKKFTDSSSFTRHKLIHSGTKKYQCDVCRQSFFGSYFSKHKLIHSGIKKYQCDVCTKSFTQSQGLAQHKLIHSGIKNYQCDVCTKSFTKSKRLVQHKLIHSGIKNY